MKITASKQEKFEVLGDLQVKPNFSKEDFGSNPAFEFNMDLYLNRQFIFSFDCGFKQTKECNNPFELKDLTVDLIANAFLSLFHEEFEIDSNMFDRFTELLDSDIVFVVVDKEDFLKNVHFIVDELERKDV